MCAPALPSSDADAAHQRKFEQPGQGVGHHRGGGRIRFLPLAATGRAHRPAQAKGAGRGRHLHGHPAPAARQHRRSHAPDGAAPQQRQRGAGERKRHPAHQ